MDLIIKMYSVGINLFHSSLKIPYFSLLITSFLLRYHIFNMQEQLDVLRSIKSGQSDQFRGAMLSGATLCVPKVGAGFLHAIYVGGDSCPTLTIYDAASGSSGTIIAILDANPPKGSYVVDVSFTYGLSAFFQNPVSAINQPAVTLSYK